MVQTGDGGAGRRGISAWVFGAVTAMMVVAMGAGAAETQAVSRNGKEVNAEVKADAHGPRSYETLYLNSAISRRDAYDVVTDLRNMLPRAKVYYVPQQKAISILADEKDLALARQVLADVDRPVKSYQVTYTLTETGGGQAAKTRHVAMLVASGGTAEVKQRARVPIATGSSDAGGKVDTQFQYLDLGLSIRAKLSGGRGHLELDSRVEESQKTEMETVAGVQEPVIQQTSLDGSATLGEGKAVSLGSLDIPASGSVGERHVTVSVMVEPAG